MRIFLRPHHGICIQQFIGKGYSDEFIKNMKQVIQTLRQQQAEVTLVCAVDDICACCPNNTGGVCQSGQKVADYDARCLALCGFTENQTVSWLQYEKAVRENIIKNGKLAQVCAGCQWLELCTSFY